MAIQPKSLFLATLGQVHTYNEPIARHRHEEYLRVWQADATILLPAHSTRKVLSMIVSAHNIAIVTLWNSTIGLVGACPRAVQLCRALQEDKRLLDPQPVVLNKGKGEQPITGSGGPRSLSISLLLLSLERGALKGQRLQGTSSTVSLFGRFPLSKWEYLVSYRSIACLLSEPPPAVRRSGSFTGHVRWPQSIVSYQSPPPTWLGTKTCRWSYTGIIITSNATLRNHTRNPTRKTTENFCRKRENE